MQQNIVTLSGTVKCGLIPFLLLLLFVSCEKDVIEFIPDLSQPDNAVTLAGQFTDQPASFITEYTGKTTVLNTPGDVIVEIPDNALCTPEGEAVRGTIKFELMEYTGKRKNLLISPPTLTDDECLSCQRLIRFRISYKGKEVKIVQPVRVYVPSSTSLISETGLYVNEGTNADNHWSAVPTKDLISEDGVWQIAHQGTTYSCRGYRVEIWKGDNWYCIGRSFAVRQNEEAGSTLHLGSAYTHKNTLVYFMAKQENALIRLDWNEAMSNFTMPFTPKQNPVEGKIIILATFGDNTFHFSTENAVWNNEPLQADNPAPTSRTDIQSALNGL